MRWKNSTIPSATWDMGTDAEGLTLATILKDCRSSDPRSWSAKIHVLPASYPQDVPGGPFTRDEAQQAAETAWRDWANKKAGMTFGAGQ